MIILGGLSSFFFFILQFSISPLGGRSSPLFTAQDADNESQLCEDKIQVYFVI